MSDGSGDRAQPVEEPGRSEAGFVEVGHQRLEWRAWGDAGAPLTLVLLHEGLGSVGLWHDFPGRLAAAAGARVFAYSRAGYGHSSPVSLPRPLDYLAREALETLPAVLDAVGAQTVVLVGHSDGATIAAIYAGSVEDARVRGIVLIAPHFFVEEVALAGIRRARAAYESGDLRASLARWHAHVDCAFFGWNLAWLDPAFADWSIEDLLPAVGVPVCVIQGEADEYATLAQVRAVERGVRTRVATHILPGIGHAPHREAGEELVRIVAGFVSDCAGAKV